MKQVNKRIKYKNLSFLCFSVFIASEESFKIQLTTYCGHLPPQSFGKHYGFQKLLKLFYCPVRLLGALKLSRAFKTFQSF
jgi:hypothetical protein